MGTDGTLTLLVPRRHLARHWLLAGGGDPADLAERLSPLGSRQAEGSRLTPAPPKDSGSQEPFGDALLRCLATAQPLVTVPPLDPSLALQANPVFNGASLASSSFHTQLTLQRWHRGPLWIAIWRCHGPLGWQRRCGPMSLMAFLGHPWQRPRRSGPQSPAAVPLISCHGP